MRETWKPVPGREKLYEVSDQGRVRSMRNRAFGEDVLRKTPKILKAWESGDAWRVSQGSDGTAPVSHLVLTAFVGGKPADHEACHLDGDGANNRLSNLEWVHKSKNPNRKSGNAKAAVNRRARFDGDPEGLSIVSAKRMPLLNEWRRVKPSGKEVVAVCMAAKAYGARTQGKHPTQTAYEIINQCRPEPRKGDARWHALCSLSVALWYDVYLDGGSLPEEIERAV